MLKRDSIIRYAAEISDKCVRNRPLWRFIDVYGGYRVQIDFNIDFGQFQFGLDCRRDQKAGKKHA